MTTFSNHCLVHRCTCAGIPACHSCRLEVGSEDLCRFKRTLLPVNAPELKRSPPRRLKGALLDYWVRAPGKKWCHFRDNSRFIGFYDAEYVFDQIAMHCRVEPWEYRAYMEDVARIDDDPDYCPQSRRIYVGNDNRIKESELDHFKDGGYAEDDDGQPALVTPYDQGIDDDPELNREFEEQEFNNSWKQQGVNCYKVYQHTTHTSYVVAGSYSRQVRKVVYQPERVWFIQNGRPMYADIETRTEVEYREDNTVMRKQELPTLHVISVGQEAGVVASSTVRTRKDKRFLDTLKYERRVVERHRQCLIHCDEVAANASKKQATVPA